MPLALTNQENVKQLVTFRLGSEEYGIEIANVQEIIKLPGITTVPKAPHYLEGVVNLRGHILPIIDTRKRLNLNSTVSEPSNRIVVTNCEDTSVGLVVDAVSEVLRVDSRDIDRPPPALFDSPNGYLRGICKLDEGNRLVSLLNLEAITRIDTAPGESDSTSDYPAVPELVDEPEPSSTLYETLMVSFQLGQEEYAVDIDHVEEIIKIPEITKVPDAPMHVMGIICLRGRVMPVVNLRSRFGLEESPSDKRSRILILRRDQEGEKVMVGILVDMVNEVVSLPAGMIELPPETLVHDGKLDGIGKMDQGKRLILILNPDKLTNGPESFNCDDFSASKLKFNKHSGEERTVLDVRQMVSLKLGNEEFGVDIKNVREIIRLTDITMVPGSPHYVRGVVNLRGDVLPVIDLRSRFGLDYKAPSDSDRIVVITCQNRVTGIIVDSVSEVIQLERSSIEPTSDILSEIDSTYIEGIGKLNDGKRFVIILDMAGILNLKPQKTEEVFDDISNNDVVDAVFNQQDNSIPAPENPSSMHNTELQPSPGQVTPNHKSPLEEPEISDVELSEEDQLKALQEQLLAQMDSDEEQSADDDISEPVEKPLADVLNEPDIKGSPPASSLQIDYTPSASVKGDNNIEIDENFSV